MSTNFIHWVLYWHAFGHHPYGHANTTLTVNDSSSLTFLKRHSIYTVRKIG